MSWIPGWITYSSLVKHVHQLVKECCGATEHWALRLQLWNNEDYHLSTSTTIGYQGNWTGVRKRHGLNMKLQRFLRQIPLLLEHQEMWQVLCPTYNWMEILIIWQPLSSRKKIQFILQSFMTIPFFSLSWYWLWFGSPEPQRNSLITFPDIDLNIILCFLFVLEFL